MERFLTRSRAILIILDLALARQLLQEYACLINQAKQVCVEQALDTLLKSLPSKLIERIDKCLTGDQALVMAIISLS